MKQVIYVDMLIIVNLFVNYFILLTVSKFLCIKWSSWRILIGEILGAIYSLYIFIPNQNGFISFFVKFFMAFTIIWATFGIKNKKVFVKALLCFYFFSFAFSGVMFALWCVWKPNGMAINNGVVYFNISPMMLIIFTLLSYIVIEITSRVTGKRESKKRWCQLNISFRGKSTTFKAKIDTANSLREPFSNLPVIVARQNVLKSIFPESENLVGSKIFTNIQNTAKNLDLKLRMVPFKTVAGEGLLPAFKPDFINISKNIHKEAYIAICPNKILPQETSALIGPDLLD